MALDYKEFKTLIIKGSEFPDDPFRYEPIKLSKHIISKYLPALDQVLPNGPKGLKLLVTIMANTEGFTPGSRSYRNNNPGNIGNTDDGKNKKLATLEEGINLQVKHVKDMAEGKKKTFPIGKEVTLPPYYSREIAANAKNYRAKSGWTPGYKFKVTGQLDQFVKIYAVAARVNNAYLNNIISYYKDNGIAIKPESKIQDIIKLD